MKMMYALASGTWIVSLDWLAASETANCMVAEEKFVMQGGLRGGVGKSQCAWQKFRPHLLTHTPSALSICCLLSIQEIMPRESPQTEHFSAVEKHCSEASPVS